MGRESVRSLRWIVRALQVAVVICVAGAVWLLGFSGDKGPVPLLPDTETAFSLDLSVVGSVDHELVYAVEQRARPFYRIFSLEPATGAVETVYTVPTDAIIYGTALSPDRGTLAVAYSTDFNLGGSGIWTLDLETDELVEIYPATANVYFTDPTWSPDGEAILATSVDRGGEAEALSIVSVDRKTGQVEVLAESAINPVAIGDTIYFLTVDENKARRSIGVLDGAGLISSLSIEDSQRDLDHLVAGTDRTSLRVAVLPSDDTTAVTLGDPAGAHGNHDVASEWWSLPLLDAGEPVGLGLDPIIVYDAATTGGGTIVYATNEGLSIAVDTRVDLIKSRAIRFVAG